MRLDFFLEVERLWYFHTTHYAFVDATSTHEIYSFWCKHLRCLKSAKVCFPGDFAAVYPFQSCFADVDSVRCIPIAFSYFTAAFTLQSSHRNLYWFGSHQEWPFRSLCCYKVARLGAACAFSIDATHRYWGALELATAPSYCKALMALEWWARGGTHRKYG